MVYRCMRLEKIIEKKPHEHIIYTLRPHFFTFVPNFILFFILLLIPFSAFFLLHTLFPTIIQGTIISPILILSASIYLLTIYLLLFFRFLMYYLDIWIVTNDRIIDINQHGFFSVTISELDLFRVQDVTVNIKGVFPTLFHYGNIRVETASANQHITFHNIPHSNSIREELVRLSDEDRKYHDSGIS